MRLACPHTRWSHDLIVQPPQTNRICLSKPCSFQHTIFTQSTLPTHFKRRKFISQKKKDFANDTWLDVFVCVCESAWFYNIRSVCLCPFDSQLIHYLSQNSFTVFPHKIDRPKETCIHFHTTKHLKHLHPFEKTKTETNAEKRHFNCIINISSIMLRTQAKQIELYAFLNIVCHFILIASIR